MNRREVICVADDFGASPAVNRAIIAAHERGALRGASLMLGQPGTADAVARARAWPTLQIGWHLHLCDSQPLTCAAWPWGVSPVRAGGALGLTPGGRALLRREVAAQWAAFRATGLPCAFVNSHHHLHAHPVVWRELRRTLDAEFAGWLRLGDVRWFNRGGRSGWSWFWRRRRARCPWPSSATLWGVDRLRRMNAAEVRAEVARLPAGLHEFMFHPQATEADADFAALLELRA